MLRSRKPSLGLDEGREEIRRIVAANRGLNPRVFGSVLHRDESEGGDLDLLIDAADGMTFFDMAAGVEKLIRAKVDVKTPGRFVGRVPRQGCRGSNPLMKDKKALRVPDYVQHIVVAIARIETYVEGFDLTSFIGGSLVQDAVIRNFEIIGEAASRIQAADAAFAQTMPNFGSTSPTGCATR